MMLGRIRRRQGKHPRTLLCYCERDDEFATRLTSDLCSDDLGIPVESEEIPAAAGISEHASKRIPSCGFLLVVCSSHSVRSSDLRRQLDDGLLRQASENAIGVVPLIIEKIELPGFLLPFRRADFTQSYLAGLLQLVDTFAERLEQKFPVAPIDKLVNDAGLMARSYLFHMSLDTEDILAGIQDTGMDRGCVVLSPTSVDTVHVTVSLKTNGQCFPARLPRNMCCSIAAERIAGQVLLGDLPPRRRVLYLGTGRYHFTRRPPPLSVGFHEQMLSFETVRDAGILDGDHLVLHSTASHESQHEVTDPTTDLHSRIDRFIRQILNERLHPHAHLDF